MCELQSAVEDATELHDSKMEDMEIELKAANERIAELEVRLTALADVADVVTHHLLFGQTNKAELESQIEMAKTLLGKSDG